MHSVEYVSLGKACSGIFLSIVIRCILILLCRYLNGIRVGKICTQGVLAALSFGVFNRGNSYTELLGIGKPVYYRGKLFLFGAIWTIGNHGKFNRSFIIRKRYGLVKGGKITVLRSKTKCYYVDLYLAPCISRKPNYRRKLSFVWNCRTVF